MSNSGLVTYTKLSPHCNSPRNQPIRKITIHHTAGVTTIESLGALFAHPERKGSSNYGIGNDGRIGLYVEEKNRAWTSSSPDNDHQAVTIEVSNSSSGGDWPVSNKAYAALIDLCVDICKRNNIKLIYDGTTKGTLTRHNMFAATSCPGKYLQDRFPAIADEVNKRLNTSGGSPAYDIYRVQVGAFSARANADKLLAEIKSKGFSAVVIKAKVNGNDMYRVQVGAYTVRANAIATLDKLAKAGYSGFIV